MDDAEKSHWPLMPCLLRGPLPKGSLGTLDLPAAPRPDWSVADPHFCELWRPHGQSYASPTPQPYSFVNGSSRPPDC